ncbi:MULTISPECIES: 2Fe-2S iron-sulfur cluster-binding protein [Deefgea]|uniref:2Fe-2S iron-sulfur cluster binding domain-containing protein n=1 Tax=Deefgea chitinilytica TaxID=570276 RepID=A0ABS2CBW2_9NEIS|nr:MULTISPECIES: pyridoxamine 5'-phosphate oxidase family protein [Deefgea]MBM5571135.1 2Fe-2S iron-sulfur cluster binding domain-containing protein [Deefgea chitinilytica]MBM9888365.1 pyridoxamine 5'-phosphate oxidase family protein [Deefgea sp. CFH1-16]
MPRAFAAISFTDSVKAAQTRYHSRDSNRGFELAEDTRSEMTEREAEFIAARDSFYMATVAENGWPYVQHRGGPAGFLKVLDANTLGFADFRGNVQYLSVGNLNANDKISIILMDYTNRRRLKIWGRVRIVHELENPELIAALEDPTYRARIERAMVITVEAWDWNCPQHITPRYTDADIEQLIAPLHAELKALQAKPLASAPITALGEGPLELVISGIRQLTPQVRAYELRHPAGKDLPIVTAGSHLKVPVILKNGQTDVRNYSIASNPARRDIYEIAVLRQDEGDGGSSFVHQHYQLGMTLHCGLPQNDFALIDSDAPVILIAGGIGITPIKAMAQTLKAQGRAFHLHYAARSQRDMAYGDRLQRDLVGQMTSYFNSEGQQLDLASVLRHAGNTSEVYVCGPSGLISAVQDTAKELNISAEQIHFERFSAAPHGEDVAFEVVLRRSQKIIPIAADQTVLAAVQAAGIDTLSDCGVGNCGTCAVKVLAGEVEHRDSALNQNERERAGLMCICVSRAKSARIELDL